MAVFENVLLMAGLTVVVLAYVLYLHRTQDIRGVLMFWSHRLALTPVEFRLQRGGIVLMFIGVLLRYLSILHLL
ncbi:hypothetical protein GCM10027040_17640 [Halomonas shantousis]